LKLSTLDLPLAICRLDAGAAIPAWATAGPLWSVTRTVEEVSIVCDEAAVPQGVRAGRGWRALAVEGPMDLSTTGVLASIAGPLAAAGISLFAVSTFDTDYILVPAGRLIEAADALIAAGHEVAR